jgi:hypothetical protein
MFFILSWQDLVATNQGYPTMYLMMAEMADMEETCRREKLKINYNYN